MFQKKDYIYSETMGVCRVDDVTNLAPKKGNAVSYYVLRSVYQKEKVAYIPVENHAVELRELISLEQAQEMAKEWENSEADETHSQTEAPISFDETQRYRRGEVEFVIQQAMMKASGKNEKNKKGNTKTVTTL